VEVYANIVRGSNGANGICAIDIERTNGAPHSQAVANLYAHDNVVYMTNGAGTGLVGRVSALSANNRFVNNTYYVPDTSITYWVWGSLPGNWATWQAHSQDTTGALNHWR
jgi:hypothetical protein